MAIAALSMAMSYSNVMQSVNISLMDKAMEAQDIQVQQLVEMMEAAAPPSGHQLDIRV